MDGCETIFKKTIEQKVPFLIHWELTYRCNLHCRHCYVAPQGEKRELNTKQIKKILSVLARAKALFLIWSGGEPLCRPDFPEIIRYAHRLDFAQRIFTNGTLLNSENIKAIKKIHPISVEISLYGTKPDTHDKVTRVKGSFQKSLKALLRLKEEKINIAVKFMVFKENLKEFKEAEKLSRDLQAKFVYDVNIAPRHDGSLEPIKYRLTAPELEEFLQGRPMNFEHLSFKSDQNLLCNAGLNNFSISPGGDVFPCVGIREKIGDILGDSIKELMETPLLEKLRERRTGYLTGCRGCNLIPYCNRCYGMAQMEDGDMWGKSSQACLLAKIVKKIAEERLSFEKGEGSGEKEEIFKKVSKA